MSPEQFAELEKMLETFNSNLVWGFRITWLLLLLSIGGGCSS